MARLKWHYLPLFVLHYLVLRSIKVPEAWIITGTVMLCFFFPAWKRIFVISGSLLLGLFLTGNFYSLNSYITILSPYQLSDQFQTFTDRIPLPLVNIAAYLVYLGLSAAIFITYRFLFKKFSLASSFFIILSIYSFVGLSSILGSSSPLQFLFAIGAATLLKHTWYVFLLCRDLPLISRGKPIHWLTNILPVWTQATESREALSLERYATKDSSSYDSVFQGGMRRLTFVVFWYFILVYLRIGTSTLLTSEYIGTDFGERYNEIVFNIYRTWPDQPPWKIILSIFSFGLTHILDYFLVYGQLIIATAHLCGYRMSDYSDEPWKATSFANFFGRLMYYYNYIILTYFYYPALQVTRKWNLSRQVRILLCLPFSIMTGGFLFHFMRDTYRPFQFGLIEAGEFYFRNIAPYLIFLSVTLTASVIRGQKKQIQPSLSIQQTARICAFVAIYSIGMMLNCAYFFGGLEQFPKIFMYLLGLAH